MSRRCSCCNHPAREALDAALAGGTSVRNVAAAHGLRPAAVHRHARNHLPGAIRATAEQYLADLPSEPTITPRRAMDLGDRASIETRAAAASSSSHPLQWVAPTQSQSSLVRSVAPVSLSALQVAQDLRDRALAILADAEAQRDPKTALSAIREARGLIETLARLEPSQPSGQTVALADRPEWHRVRSALIAALAPFPDARIAAAAALASVGALS